MDDLFLELETLFPAEPGGRNENGPSVTKSDNRIKGKLRQQFDGNDHFIRNFQVGGTRKYERKTPLWVHDNKKIEKVLLSAFPKLMTDETQRKRAARWAGVIHYYFRLRYTYVKVGEELGLKTNVVNGIVRSIKRASCGRKANGSGQRGGANGRPKGS
jgi:hypothetical protein